MRDELDALKLGSKLDVLASAGVAGDDRTQADGGQVHRLRTVVDRVRAVGAGVLDPEASSGAPTEYTVTSFFVPSTSEVNETANCHGLPGLTGSRAKVKSVSPSGLSCAVTFPRLPVRVA